MFQISELFNEALKKSIESGQIQGLSSIPNIPIEMPKNPEHGDRAISIAMKLSKESKIPPRSIAEILIQNVDKTLFESLEIAGPGFINLRLNPKALEQIIKTIIKENSNYGKASAQSETILVEYVSANPTGDLHLGHGRQAVLGSAIAKLLKEAGYKVQTEFYINDAGNQIHKLGKSCLEAIQIQEGKLDPSDYSTENYPLDSILEFIQPESLPQELVLESDYADYAKEIFLKLQKEILQGIHVVFDQWYSEKDNLYSKSPNQVERAIQELKNKNLIYESEAALWFKATDYGDERDRVLRKSDNSYTYLAGDLAYHQDKLNRADSLINIWGADHHGQIPSLKAGLEALGKDSTKLDIVLVQMVSLVKNGQEYKMSKREGNVVNIRDLVKEVGVDAFRYFLLASQANNRIAFDLELACKQDKDNPVYYIQYAHARACSILRQAQRTDYRDFDCDNSFAKLNIDELKSSRDLILKLASYPEEILSAAQMKAPYKIANYLCELATLFHSFYTFNRVICDDLDLMKFRLNLVLSTKIVLGNALNMLDISAPEKM